MNKQTANQLSKMKQEEQFADVDQEMLLEYLPKKFVEQMDEQRGTNVSRQLSTLPDSQPNSPSRVDRQRALTSTELKQLPSICETYSPPIHSTAQEPNSTLNHISCIIEDFQPNNERQNISFRNALTDRILTAMLVAYEKQWSFGMIRRPTLYILIKSIEQAKHQHSLELHWKLIIEQFQLSKWLQILMLFDHVNWIKKQLDELLFDHIFLTVESMLGNSVLFDLLEKSFLFCLAFYSARPRMDDIREQFPELAIINTPIWNDICKETDKYHPTASYILHDLQQSYKDCWRIHMTKRCAQMLLKYESETITEIYQTGMLGSSAYSHILRLIEKKSFHLEF
jgi:hypothetical protein